MKSFFKTLFASLAGTFIALLLTSLFMVSLLGSLFSLEAEVPEIPSSAILHLNFSNAIAEQTIEDPLAIEGVSPLTGKIASATGILDYVQAIDQAAQDPAIEFIFMNPFNLQCGMTHAEEIRNALARFRQAGKAVIAYGEHFGQLGYYLSSVADKVYMNPTASNDLVGLSANMFFLKDLLESIGVDIQLIRHGKYKSAGEMFVRNGISEDNREQNQVMISSIWKSVCTAICKSRGITPEDFNRAIDNLELVTAEDMVKASLVDELVTRNEMNAKLCELFQVDRPKDLRFVSVENYFKAKVKPSYKIKDKVAVIFANGEINFKGEGLTSDKFCKVISDVRKDSTIKSVVFRVNSPGGVAQAAELIRQELMLLRETKPVIVSFGDYAASGGYWISANSDKIFTNELTLTGSIGVFSMIPSLEKTMKKIKVNSVSITSNKHSDLLSLHRPLDETEVRFMQDGVEYIYDQFLGIVASGRDMSKEKVDEIAQGRVWAGTDALDIHLADSRGDLKEALEYAASSADLEKYRIVQYPKVESLLDKLINSATGTAEAVKIATDPLESIKAVYSSMKEEITGTYARLPYYYEWNK